MGKRIKNSYIQVGPEGTMSKVMVVLSDQSKLKMSFETLLLVGLTIDRISNGLQAECLFTDQAHVFNRYSR